MKQWTMLTASLLAGSVCLASHAYALESNVIHNGIFLGLGADYNSLGLTQNSYGKGISNIITSTGDNSNGIADGYGAPFHNTTNTFSPTIQAGYFKNFNSNPNYLYGVKFSYQYLGSTATNPDLYIPQLGTMTSNTGVTSSLFGYVIADSVQAVTRHEFSLLAFIGQVFGNKYFYIGAGPSLFNVQSKNYYSIGYAEFEGATVNVTGLVTYSTPSLWLLGGAAQIGMTYFITPSWFIDLAYTYAITGNKTVYHQQTFTNSSSVGSVDYTTSGTLFTKNTMSISNQSARLTINKIL